MIARPAVPRVVVLATLALGIGLLDAAAITHDRRREADRTPVGGALVTFNPTAVHKLTLSRAGRTPMVLERVQGGWVAFSHKGYPARGSRVDAILARLASWKRERVAGDKASQARFNVTPESAIGVKLEDSQGRTIGELAVGTLTGIDAEAARQQSGHVDPGSIGRCVRVLPDDAIYVVQDFVTGELEPEPTEWLERPTSDEAKIRALSISHRMGESVAFHLDATDPRLGDGRPIDLEKARPFAREVGGLAPSDVASSEDDPRLGLLAPRATIDVALEGLAQPMRLIVGDEISGTGSATYPGISPPTADKWGPLVPVRISGRPSTVLVAAGALQRLLELKPDALLLTHALASRVEGVTRLELTREARTIVLAQEGADWTVTVVGPGATPKKLDTEAGKAARARAIAAATTGLAIASSERPAAPLAPVAHGLGSPALKLVLDLGHATHRELVVASPEGDFAWAKRSDSPCALALPARAFNELVAAFDALP